MELKSRDSKYLPVSKLIELLSTLPSDTKVTPNRVGNLALYDDKENFIGFVDFLSEGEIEFYERV